MPRRASRCRARIWADRGARTVPFFNLYDDIQITQLAAASRGRGVPRPSDVPAARETRWGGFAQPQYLVVPPRCHLTPLLGAILADSRARTCAIEPVRIVPSNPSSQSRIPSLRALPVRALAWRVLPDLSRLSRINSSPYVT